jgi:hypothetical protein
MLKQLNATKQGAPLVEDEDVPEHLRSTAAPAKAPAGGKAAPVALRPFFPGTLDLETRTFSATNARARPATGMDSTA